MLPVYSEPERAIPEDLYRDFFETPQNVNIGHLAKASDIPYQKVESTEALRKIDLSGVEGPLIVECITSADTSMNLRKALWNHTYENYY
jgi:2-succinyl-5-enolpyruvyl-6-hydroxy-3-cyclohexene-1-carboxylate synthase